MADSIWEELVDGTLKYAIDKVGSVSFVASRAFVGCNGLLAVSLSALTHIYSEAFAGCVNLRVVNMPNVEWVGFDAFYGCNKLVSVDFPHISNLGIGTFQGCEELNTVKLHNPTYIPGNCFVSCSSLFSLYLYGSSIYGLASKSVFSGTPIWGLPNKSYGSIYVPSSLYYGYMTESTWRAFANRFAKIEG